MTNRLIAGWVQVVKRSVANWRILSSVVFGALLASTMMASTTIYFDALKEVALKQGLQGVTTSDLDVILQGKLSPVSSGEHDRFLNRVNNEIDRNIGWMLREKTVAGKTPTLFLSTVGNENLAGSDNARAYIAFSTSIKRNIKMLMGGSFPQSSLGGKRENTLEVEAVVPREAAELFNVTPGDKFVVVLPATAGKVQAVITVSGVFDRNDISNPVWVLEKKVLNDATGTGFRTMPMYVTETEFVTRIGAHFKGMEAIYAWHLSTDIGSLTVASADRAKIGLETMNSNLGVDIGSYRQTTDIDDVINRYDRKLFYSKLPMFAVLIVVTVVILYYVSTLAAVLVDDRRSEMSVLRSRGASGVQILAVFAIEGVTIVALTIIVAPLLAAVTVSLLGYTPAFSGLTGGHSLKTGITLTAYFMSFVGGLFSFVALMVPSIQAARIEVTRHRQEEGRPSVLPMIQRYYLDVLLLVVCIFLYKQLLEQGEIIARRFAGDVAIDYLLLALPGIVLIALGMVLIRLFPLSVRIITLISIRWMPVAFLMGLWQMTRSSTHYARLLLLLILTAGLGMFASSFGATLERSFSERVYYAVGADARIDQVESKPVFVGTTRWSTNCKGEETQCVVGLPTKIQAQESARMRQFEDISGVEKISPVLRITGRDMSKFYGDSFEMLSIETESFSQVAWYREDFAGGSLHSLLRAIETEDREDGVVLPYGTIKLRVRMKSTEYRPTVKVTARVLNAQGRYSTHELGVLGSKNWVVLESDLGFGTSQYLEIGRPLTLVSLGLHQTGNRKFRAGSVLFDEIQVVTETGEIIVVNRLNNPRGWSVLEKSADITEDALVGIKNPIDNSGMLLFTWSEGRPLATRGIKYGGVQSALPVLASEGFVKTVGYKPGDTFYAAIEGHDVQLKVVGIVRLFPTMMKSDKKFLISNLSDLLRSVNVGAIKGDIQPNEAWLAIDKDINSSLLTKELESVQAFSTGHIYLSNSRLAEAKVDVLVESGWRALLFVAFLVVLVLSGFGFLIHNYVSFKNRKFQISILRVIGFSVNQIVAMVLLEQLLVICMGLTLGAWMGGRMSATIMPFLGYDDWGGQVIPPFVSQVGWMNLLATYATMIVVFAIVVTLVAFLIQRISIHRIIRLG